MSWSDHLVNILLPVWEPLGGRFGGLQVRFIVQDGTIWRVASTLDMHAPRKHIFPNSDDVDGDLVLYTQSRQSLRESPPRTHWILGGNEQLADHPTYKVGRPGGCLSCLKGEMTYSLDASHDDIVRFTSYNFDCFTSKNCQILEDLLPAAKEWHLYDPPWGIPDTRPPQPPGPPTSCRTPVWAIGRDATAIIAIDVLATSQIKDRSWDGHDFTYEKDSVRLNESLKDLAPWPSGTDFWVVPYAGDVFNPPFEAAEHVTVKHRYLAILYGPFPDQHQPLPPEVIRDGPGIKLDRCGVLDDTPANRAELAKGFATNYHLRVPEL